MGTEKQNFVNDEVRVIAEEIRATLAKYANMRTSWDAGLNADFVNSVGTPYDDGRPDEGLTQMTEADIHSFVSVMAAINTASNTEIIEKPTVRPLQTG